MNFAARWLCLTVLFALAAPGSYALAQTPDAREQAARNEARLLQLEEQIRSLQGALETLEFEASRNDLELRNEIDALKRGLERSTVEEIAGVVAEEGTAQPDGGGTRPGTSGTIPRSALLGLPATEGSDNEPPDNTGNVSSGSAAEDYDAALSLLRSGEWAAAQASFENFLQNFPDDELAPTGAYWLGETYFVRGDYGSAAATFARNYRAYGPASPKAADSLLKLGISLARLGDLERACQTFAQLDQRREPIPLPIRQATIRESESAGC